jgi:Transposase zinc-ribbon domain
MQAQRDTVGLAKGGQSYHSTGSKTDPVRKSPTLAHEHGTGVPETLVDAVRYFTDPDVCLNFLAEVRWPEGVTCPVCGGQAVTFLKNQRRWKCREVHERRQFSVKAGTIFEDSPIGLDKWLPAVWMIVNDKNGISSYEVARSLGITQKSAWFMTHRIRLAMKRGGFDKMRGEVEADETYIGGKARFMRAHSAPPRSPAQAARTSAVMGLLERHGPEGYSRVRVKKGGARFVDRLRAVVGKRVTYKSLTGKLLLVTT